MSTAAHTHTHTMQVSSHEKY